MLKLVVLSACLALAAAATFDGVDVNALLQREEVVNAYISCVTGAGPCNESGLRLKSIVPNALTENCSKCSPLQKAIISKIAQVMSERYPAEWDKLLESEDPKKEHRPDIAKLIEAGKALSAAPVAPAAPAS